MSDPIKAPRRDAGLAAAAHRPAPARARRRPCAVFERAGFRQIVTPTFEDTALFARTVGRGLRRRQQGDVLLHGPRRPALTLRPEGTAPVMRAYLQHGLAREPQPVRLWYSAAMFRYARAQRGRYREHTQFGVESIGSDDPATDAEVIALQAAWFAELGLPDLELHLNSIGDRACRPAYRERLLAFLDEHLDELSEDSRRRRRQNPLRFLDSKDEADRRLVPLAPSITRPPLRGLRRALRAGARVPRRARRRRTSSTRRSCAASTTTSAPPGSGSGPASAASRRSRAAGATTAWPRPSAASARPAWASAAASSASCWRMEAAGQEARAAAGRRVRGDHRAGGAPAPARGHRRAARARASRPRPTSRGAAARASCGRPSAWARASSCSCGPEEWGRGTVRLGDGELRRRGDGRGRHGEAGRGVSYRDMLCGEPRGEHADRVLSLAGWVGRRRDHGGLIFIDLRDRSGLVQLVIDPEHSAEAHAVAHGLRLESVVRARGDARARAPRRRATRALPTGDVELRGRRARAARAQRAAAVPARRRERRRGAAHPPPLPRPAPPARCSACRSCACGTTRIMRRFLEERGFWDLETPMLTKSTPEGARDFLVPGAARAGLVLRAAAEPAALQAAADDVAASTATTRSPAASATRPSAPTASSSSRSSTSR